MLVNCKVNPSIKFAGTHLYTWGKRGTVRAKWHTQEHNTMSPARNRTLTARSGDVHTNHEAATPPPFGIIRPLYATCSDFHPNDANQFTQGCFFLIINIVVRSSLSYDCLLLNALYCNSMDGDSGFKSVIMTRVYLY